MKSATGLLLVLLGSVTLSGAEEEWRTLRVPERDTSGIVVEHRAHVAGEIERVVRLVEIARDRFFALADTTFSITINVVVASSEREFGRITAGMIPDWGAAVAIPDQQLIIVALNAPGKPLEESVIHEVSHVLLGRLGGSRVPRWFDEGVAMYLAHEWDIYDSFRLARGALGRGLIPLSRIDKVLTFHQDQAWLAYSQSFAAVAWLATHFGRQALGKTIRNLDRMSFDDALFEATGYIGESFERKWLDETRHRYALIGLADDMWLWSLVIPGLFFLALAVRWWRNRRTMRRWRREESGDDDERDEPLDERIADTY